jgi:hypothetical protein
VTSSILSLPNSSSNSNRKWRQQTVYQGGELRIPSDSSSVHAAFAFEGLDFKAENRQRGRLQKNLLAKNPSVDNVEPFKHSFIDSGIFGLKLSGSSSHVYIH